MSEYRELLLGCGFRRKRLIDPYLYKATIEVPIVLEPERWRHVTTVDMNPDCQPDLVIDLRKGWWIWAGELTRSYKDVLCEHPMLADALHFRSDCFDEVHAYELLEHLGALGDEQAFFRDFEEIWRVLKPGGFLCATVPSRYSDWLWGDPGHRRAILPVSLLFLQQPHYERAVGTSPSSDYRAIYRGDFDILHTYDSTDQHVFVLQAIKPARSTSRPVKA